MNIQCEARLWKLHLNKAAWVGGGCTVVGWQHFKEALPMIPSVDDSDFKV